MQSEHLGLGQATYNQLRRMAAANMQGQAALLQPTAVVHEAWMKVARHRPDIFADRAHFLSLAARAMRQIIVDHARARAAVKRGGDRVQVSLSGVDEATGDDELHDVLTINAQLDALAEVDPRRARVVELKFFGGMTTPEIAAALEASVSTVERDWRIARAWLRSQLAG